MPQTAAGFSRCLRLLDGKEFSNVFKYKRPYHGRYFSIYTVPNHLQHPRMGLAVSKRVSKKAVQRNRIKRQARETFRLMQASLVKMDFVIVAKVGCAEQENRVLSHELQRLWQKVGQKCKNY